MKAIKLLLLVAMIMSDLMMPIRVFADEISTPSKGDVGINNKVSENGESATVKGGSLNSGGDVLVTKTVKKTDVDGRYEVKFRVEGKDFKRDDSKTEDVYAVIVFDKSGSMNCVRYEGQGQGRYCADTGNKWSSAVNGAITFANTLSSKINGAKIALVSFSGWSDYNRNGLVRGADTYDDAGSITVNGETWFDGKDLDSRYFGGANGGTNLQAGLETAKGLIDELNSSDDTKSAFKYVVVISDGQPTYYYDEYGYTRGNGQTTDYDTYDKTIKAASELKDAGAEVFSIGYSLPNKSDKDYKSASDILGEVASTDYDEVVHYVNADPESVANAFNNIASNISYTKAGKNATLIDNIGGAFTLSTGDTSREYIKNIGDITENGNEFSFFVDINQDSPTGWYNTNNGFVLKYTDYNGVEREIRSNEDPQVYWVQNTYKYIVNYYQDDFDNLLKSEEREATLNTVINEDNVGRDKYLPEGYEFAKMNPDSITIKNDGEEKVINILYVIKKFSYVVNYYYDDVKESSNTISDVTYGTVVKAEDYYLASEDVRTGYVLDSSKTDSGNYTIKDNNVVIDIYYKKNSFGYKINYFFNNNNDFSKSDSALYGDRINALDNHLSSDELNKLNRSDFFLDPDMYEENYNGSMTIGTDSDKNVLNIYYINTNFDNNNEVIKKEANIDKVTGLNDKIGYTISYSTKFNNVRKGDEVVVTIVDRLPKAIDLDNSDLSGGVYNSEDNSITWVRTYNVNEFKREYVVNTNISYVIKYVDYISVNGKTLVNTANGTTSVREMKTAGVTDKAEVNVEIKGNVTVLFKDQDGNEIADRDILGERLAGARYTTSSKEILGYTLDSDKLPDNRDGYYTDGDIFVTYYYIKNDGTVLNPDVLKTGPSSVNSVNGVFDYTISGSADVKDYVGEAKLIVKDSLPYAIDIEKSVLDNRCSYNENDMTITCTKIYNVDQDSYTDGLFSISESFELKLVFVGIDSDVVINKAQTIIDLDGNKTPSEETEVVTNVLKGSLIVKHVSGNTILETEDEVYGLGGDSYNTSSKEFYGYTLDINNLPDNAKGEFISNSTITVIYNYIKNDGKITDNEVNKLQKNVIGSIDSEYNYVLSYKGKIEDYVGEVTLELTDVLPYNVVITSMDNRCRLDGKTIVCSQSYVIDEDNQVINEVFDIRLRYISVGSEVTNVVDSKLIYGNNSVTDRDEVTDKVPYGKVIVSYKDTDGNILTDDVMMTDLVGMEYVTEEKDFFGYSLTEVNGDVTGSYTEGTIYVEYIYTKTIGDGDIEEEPPQTGINGNSMYDYLLLIGMIMIALRGYKLGKETR